MTTVTFTQANAPALVAGTYTVSVNQTIAVPGDPGEILTASATFNVVGQRFSFAPGTVWSQYPAAGALGDYSATLPYVALSDPTLPWQRSETLLGAPAPKDAKEAGATASFVEPWLGLLLFDEGDPPPSRVVGTLSDLMTAANGGTLPAGIYCAQLNLEEGQALTDPLAYIDVPAPLFNAIAPLASDLTWLAHVQTSAGLSGQATSGTSAPPPAVSVVIANRFPMPGNVTTVHLVSFESWGSSLAPFPGGELMVDGVSTAARLISLASWSFTGVGAQVTFGAQASALSTGALQRPLQDGGGGSQAVVDAFAMGYTALNHTLRDGSTTVSWYRGPFLPEPLPIDSGWPTSIQSADALLRYDPTTGLFDTSYSSAWTVGNLLALHDAGFSAALTRIAAAVGQGLAGALDSEQLGAMHDRAVGPSSDPAATTHARRIATELVTRAVKWGLKPDAPAAVTSRAPSSRRRVQRDALKAALNGTAHPATYSLDASLAGSDIELAAEWLAGLLQLEGVPPQWLVPDSSMLPIESIRFFTVDPNWVEALQAGALSIVNAATPLGPALGGNLRQRARDKRGIRRRRLVGGAAPEAGAPPGATSGFLLRSAMVAAYPGMVATAADGDGNALPLLRFETLSSNLLLALFDGQIATVVLQQPNGSVAFGADPESNPAAIDLRQSTGADAGTPLGKTMTMTVPLRPNPAITMTRTFPPPTPSETVNVPANTGGAVACITSLALSLANDTSVFTPTTAQPAFTPAEFGLQLVQPIESISFSVQPG